MKYPPLSMVNDLLCVSECGFRTKSLHAFLTFKTESKKLQFGAQKCKKLHVGKRVEGFKCQTLKVDHWKEIETGSEKIEDICDEEYEMEESGQEKYLGDILSVDGRNINNIKSRVAKGTGIISKILSILDGIPFGQYYFEVALILRDSLLLSSILCNSESWYNVTKAELDLIESVDLQFLRRVLNIPKSTPKEMIYLELGCTPLRYIIKKRRILFLHYILNQDPKSMLFKFLMTQMKHKKKKDWSVQVFSDLEKLKMDDDVEQIKSMKKLKLKSLLDEKIKMKVFEELNSQKDNHSKVSQLIHDSFEMQKYLKPNNMKITKEEAQEIFKLRSRMSDVKSNYKGKYESLKCEMCDENEDETQKHILICKRLNISNEEIPNYEDIFDGNANKKIAITRKFIQNIKLREKLKF